MAALSPNSPASAQTSKMLVNNPLALSPSDVSSMSSSGVASPVGGITPSDPTVTTASFTPAAPITSNPNPAQTTPGTPNNSNTTVNTNGNVTNNPIPNPPPAPVTSNPNPAQTTPGTPNNSGTSVNANGNVTNNPNTITPVDFTPPIQTFTPTTTPITPSQPVTSTATVTPASTTLSNPASTLPNTSATTDQSGTAASQIPIPSPSSFVAPPAPTSVNETEYQQTLNTLAQQAATMATSTDDPAMRVAANTAILSMSQMNDAQKAALQMQINSDPTLAGQGAGYAALASLAASQNANMDNTMGQLSQTAAQQIIAMQQFGMTQGLQVEQVAQGQAFNDAQSAFTQAQTVYSDTTSQLDTNTSQQQTSYEDEINAAQTVFTNAQTSIQTQIAEGQLSVAQGQLALQAAQQTFNDAQTVASIQRTNIASDVQTLENAGNFQGAANLQTAAMNQQYPGSGIVITAAGLQASNPQAMAEFNSQMTAITALAATNPTQAQALLAPLLTNPAYAPFFPPNESASDIINNIVQGNTSKNISTVDSIQTEINTSAAAGQTFAQVEGYYPALFSASNQNAVQIGQGLVSTPQGLASINALRAADGLSAFSAGPNGTIVDDTGTPITSDDYSTIAYLSDYNSKVTQANAQPWSAAEKAILSGPGIQTMLSDSLYTGGMSGLESVLQQYFTNPANFTQNADGTINYNTSNLQLPWNNPTNYSQFYTFPTASFNSDGTVSNPASIDLGGDVYGSTVNGQVITATPSDANLNNLYTAYVKSGNPANLTAQQWYFATAGGTTPVNASLLDSTFTDSGTSTTLNTLLKSPSNPANSSTNTGGQLTTPGATTPGVIDPATQASLKNTFSAMAPAAAATYLQNPTNVASLIQNQVVPVLNSTNTIPTTDAAWTTLTTQMNGYLAINGSMYQAQSDQSVLVGKSDDPNRFYYMPLKNVNTGQTIYMVVNASGSTATKAPVGTAFTVIPSSMGSNSAAEDAGAASIPFNQIGVTPTTNNEPTPPGAP